MTLWTLKRFRIGIALALVLAVAAGLGAWMLWPSGTLAQIDAFALANGEPGVYHLRMEKFTRHGPLIGQMPSHPDLLFDQERLVIDGQWRDLGNGQTVDAVQTIETPDGDVLYTLRSANGDSIEVVDHRNGNAVRDGGNRPALVSAPRIEPYAEVRARFVEGGWLPLSDASLSGRDVARFEMVLPLSPQSKPGPGSWSLPVYYDLNPVNQRTVLQVDKATGLVIRHDRYAVQSSGAEVLIEWFEITVLRKEE